MADIVVPLVVKRLAGFLDDLVDEDAKRLRGVTDDIRWIHIELSRMQCFLKRGATIAEGAKVWAREVVDIANEVEDIVDRMPFVIERKKEGLRGSFKRYASKPFRMKALYDVGYNLKQLKRKMNEIEKSRISLGIEENYTDENDPHVEQGIRSNRSDASTSQKDAIGIENDAKKIMNMLLDKETSRLVVTITGQGGIGKTTLARKVYERTEGSSFSCRAWLSLSMNYISKNHGVDKLLIGITKQLAPFERYKVQNMNKEELRDHVKLSLTDKPYLIVLDNMCEVEVWDEIKTNLPDCKNGSRVVITSRVGDVAKLAIPSFPPYRLHGLSYEDGWDLFIQRAFIDGEEVANVCVGELRDLAEKIVRYCHGLPLALILFGGLLVGKEKTWVSWHDKVKSINWQEKKEDRICLGILKICYEDLPPHLKWCILYLAALPTDGDVDVERLIKLWVAEGFVVEADESRGTTKEDTARSYLEELQQRCLVQCIERSKCQLRKLDSFAMFKDERATFCQMHGLLRDLCEREARETNFMIIDGNAIENTLRRCAISKGVATISERNSSLRTIVAFKVHEFLVDLKVFKLLRVVDLEQCYIKEIPDEIGDLYHLRYLGLGGTDCKNIPNSICELSNLETIDLRGTCIKDLPTGVWKIMKLRHVHCDCQPYISETAIPSELQTLDHVRTGPWIDAALSKLTNLRFLDMQGDMSCYPSLGLPSNLVVLNLYGSRFGEDVWIQLQELKFLKVLFLCLDAYPSEAMTCKSNGFTRLEDLSLFKLDNLETWVIEEGAMPLLIRVSIAWCHRLCMIPDGMQHLIQIEELVCKDMPLEFLDRIQGEEGEDWHKISHIPHLQIDMVPSHITALLALASQHTAKARALLQGVDIEEALASLDLEEASLMVRVHNLFHWLVDEMEKLMDYLLDREDSSEHSMDRESLLEDVCDAALGIYRLGERLDAFVSRMRRRSIWSSVQCYAFKTSYFRELRLIAEDAQVLVSLM